MTDLNISLSIITLNIAIQTLQLKKETITLEKKIKNLLYAINQRYNLITTTHID